MISAAPMSLARRILVAVAGQREDHEDDNDLAQKDEPPRGGRRDGPAD